MAVNRVMTRHLVLRCLALMLKILLWGMRSARKILTGLLPEHSTET